MSAWERRSARTIEAIRHRALATPVRDSRCALAKKSRWRGGAVLLGALAPVLLGALPGELEVAIEVGVGGVGAGSAAADVVAVAAKSTVRITRHEATARRCGTEGR